MSPASSGSGLKMVNEVKIGKNHDAMCTNSTTDNSLTTPDGEGHSAQVGRLEPVRLQVRGRRSACAHNDQASAQVR